MVPPRVEVRVRYAKPTAPLWRRRLAANPGSVAGMTKPRTTASKPQRRPRGEIDRNYFFGDVLIKTGVAVAVALGMIAIYTPFSLRDAIDDGMFDYVGVMGVFAGVGVFLFLYGRHLRKEATHWDFD
jgi:hypothetical protein